MELQHVRVGISLQGAQWIRRGSISASYLEDLTKLVPKPFIPSSASAPSDSRYVCKIITKTSLCIPYHACVVLPPRYL